MQYQSKQTWRKIKGYKNVEQIKCHRLMLNMLYRKRQLNCFRLKQESNNNNKQTNYILSKSYEIPGLTTTSKKSLTSVVANSNALVTVPFSSTAHAHNRLLVSVLVSEVELKLSNVKHATYRCYILTT